MVDDSLCEVIITAPDEQWLVDFTTQLITDRLAAGGHHTTIRSVYTWNGSIHDRPETRVALHTRTSLVDTIVTRTSLLTPTRSPA